MIKIIVKMEGLAIFLACLFFYNELGTSWFTYFLLVLLPDISMIGYLKSNKIGAVIYNLIHNYAVGLATVFLGLWQNDNFLISLGIIVVSHIGMDRFLGYGLKYNTGFKDTHIQKL